MGEPAESTLGGLAYLLIIIGGVFAQAFVFQRFPIAGDAEATLRLIELNAAAWRTGLAVNLSYLALNVPVGVILFRILNPHSSLLAKCALGFILITAAIEGLNLLFLYAPLMLLENAASRIDGAALSYLAIQLHAVGLSFTLMFCAAFCALTGLLIIRSRLIPRLIGALMIIAGLCYVTNALMILLAPHLWQQLSPMNLLPCLVAEMSLALWLLACGTKTVPRNNT